jgi:hypothetical protein
MRRYLSRITLMLLLTAPALYPQESTRWSVKEIMTLGAQNGAEFSMVSGLAVDHRGAIYVSDQISCSLSKYGSDGHLLGRTGKRGDRPGEFRSPASVLTLGDTVVVMQSSNPVIQFFTSDLVPLGSGRPYDGQPVSLAVDGMGSLVIAGVRNRWGRQMLRFLPSLLATTGPDVTLPPSRRADGFSDVCHLAVTSAGQIVVAYLFENRVIWIRRDGTLVRSLAVPQLRRLTPEESKARIPGETAVKSVVADMRGRIFLLGGSLAPHPHRDVFIFTHGGKYLGLATLPYPSRLLAIDRKGFLYGTSNESTAISKYAILPSHH